MKITKITSEVHWKVLTEDGQMRQQLNKTECLKRHFRRDYSKQRKPCSVCSSWNQVLAEHRRNAKLHDKRLRTTSHLQAVQLNRYCEETNEKGVTNAAREALGVGRGLGCSRPKEVGRRRHEVCPGGLSTLPPPPLPRPRPRSPASRPAPSSGAGPGRTSAVPAPGAEGEAPHGTCRCSARSCTADGRPWPRCSASVSARAAGGCGAARRPLPLARR